ncbi:MAG: VanZ family protein [Planctomycetaceae bacterium]
MTDQPGRLAGERARFATTITLVVYWLTLFAATHVPKVPRVLPPQISDKWQHYVAYAVLGGLLTCWWWQRRGLTWRSALGLVLVIAAYGAFDESTQPLFGRESDLLDWRADAIGAATGVALFSLSRRRRCDGPHEVSQTRVTVDRKER